MAFRYMTACSKSAPSGVRPPYVRPEIRLDARWECSMSGRPHRGLVAVLSLAVAFASALIPATSYAAPAAPKAPRTVVLDGKRLQDAKRRLDQGDAQLRDAVRKLTAVADGWLSQGPWTVVDKPK